MTATLIAFLVPLALAQRAVPIDSIATPTPVEGERCRVDEEDCRWTLVRYNKYDRAFQCRRSDSSLCPSEISNDR